MALHLLQAGAELFKLSLDRTQNRPDLAGAFLDCQRAEAHLQGVEQCRHRGGACNRDLILALQQLCHTAGNDLGIQPLKRQKQDAEAGGVGYLDVLVMDILCLSAQHIVQRLAHRVDSGCIAALLRCLQVGVGIAGELGVNGQPDRAALPRQLDRKFHAVGAAGHRSHIFLILAGGQDLLKDRAKLHLAQYAAGLYPGKHLLEAADIGGEILHLSQTLIDLLQLGADCLKGVVNPLLQCVLQLFLDRAAYLIQLFVVVGTDRVQPLHQRAAHAVHPGGVGILQIFQAVFHHCQLGKQGIVGRALAGCPGAVDGLEPGGAIGCALALIFGQHGGKVAQRCACGAGALPLHGTQLLGQQIGFALQHRRHGADKIVRCIDFLLRSHVFTHDLCQHHSQQNIPRCGQRQQQIQYPIHSHLSGSAAAPHRYRPAMPRIFRSPSFCAQHSGHWGCTRPERSCPCPCHA